MVNPSFGDSGEVSGGLRDGLTTTNEQGMLLEALSLSQHWSLCWSLLDASIAAQLRLDGACFGQLHFAARGAQMERTHGGWAGGGMQLNHDWLVVWNHGFFFLTFHTLGMSSFQVTLIFFRGVGIPPTSVVCTFSYCWSFTI